MKIRSLSNDRYVIKRRIRSKPNSKLPVISVRFSTIQEVSKRFDKHGTRLRCTTIAKRCFPSNVEKMGYTFLVSKTQQVRIHFLTKFSSNWRIEKQPNPNFIFIYEIYLKQSFSQYSSKWIPAGWIHLFEFVLLFCARKVANTGDLYYTNCYINY